MKVSNNSEKQQSKSNKSRIIIKFCSITVVCSIIVIFVFILNVFNSSENIQGRFVDIAVCDKQTSLTASGNSNVKCAAINNKNELIMWDNNGLKKPQKLLNDVKSIKLFPKTSMAIKKDDSLWVWENNRYEHERIGNLVTSEVPQKLLDNVKSVVRYWTGVNELNYWVKDNNDNCWQWGDEKEFNKLDSDEELSKAIVKDCDVRGLIHLCLYADSHLEGEFWDEDSMSIVKETIFDNIDDIENGIDTGMILAQNGTLYFVGKGTSLEYPVASKCQYIREICKNVKGAYYDDSNRFGIVLTNNGELYSWGNNELGCLGNKDISQTETNISLKLIMESVEDFGTSDFNNIGSETKLEISSGIIRDHQYILARKSDGTLYGWGNNEKQQIGVGKNDKTIKIPTKIMDNVKKCVSCNGVNFALTNDGNIFRWGANKVPEKITK